MTPPAPTRSRKSAVLNPLIILGTALLSGTLDLLGAFALHGYIIGNTPPGRVLQAIARGVFGNAAFGGGARTAYWGLFLHYVITLLFTVFYFAWCPYVPFLTRQRVAAGVLYGLFVWTVMNFVVLPFSRAGTSLVSFESAAWSLGLVIVCVGMPIALLAHRRSATF